MSGTNLQGHSIRASIVVSKTIDGSSNLSAPANIKGYDLVMFN